MADTVDELATYLGSVTPSLGLIVKRKMPATPNKVLVITDYGGAPPEHQFGSPSFKFEHPGIQIRSRGEVGETEEPRIRLQKAFVELGKIQGIQLSGTLYRFVSAQQSPFILEEDTNKRTVYAVNFAIDKEISA